MTSPTYSVAAKVVDLRQHTPMAGAAFVVDTNVWFWLAYTRASMALDDAPLPYQIRDYPQFIKRVRTARGRLLRCGLTLAELANVIERCERGIFSHSHVGSLSTKTYRHDHPTERMKVVAEIDTAWKTVGRASEWLDLPVGAAAADKVIGRLGACCVDGTDCFLVEAMLASGITQLVTDDGDFSSVADLVVFTANPTLLAAAKAQGRLISAGAV